MNRGPSSTLLTLPGRFCVSSRRSSSIESTPRSLLNSMVANRRKSLQQRRWPRNIKKKNSLMHSVAIVGIEHIDPNLLAQGLRTFRVFFAQHFLNLPAFTPLIPVTGSFKSLGIFPPCPRNNDYDLPLKRLSSRTRAFFEFCGVHNQQFWCWKLTGIAGGASRKAIQQFCLFESL